MHCNVLDFPPFEGLSENNFRDVPFIGGKSRAERLKQPISGNSRLNSRDKTFL